MLIEDRKEEDYLAEFLKLRAINDQFRMRGKDALWEQIETQCAALNRELSRKAIKLDGELIRTGRQPWQFDLKTEAGAATMVGERFGIRYRGQTLLVEIGWPHEPQHGFIPGGALARARVNFSPNVMIDPIVKVELALWREGAEVSWYEVAYKQKGMLLTEARLRTYLEPLLKM
jgi:hypothetical protein